MLAISKAHRAIIAGLHPTLRTLAFTAPEHELVKTRESPIPLEHLFYLIFNSFYRFYCKDALPLLLPRSRTFLLLSNSETTGALEKFTCALKLISCPVCRSSPRQLLSVNTWHFHPADVDSIHCDRHKSAFQYSHSVIQCTCVRRRPQL